MSTRILNYVYSPILLFENKQNHLALMGTYTSVPFESRVDLFIKRLYSLGVTPIPRNYFTMRLPN